MQRKRPEEGFLSGYKPAVLASPKSPFYDDLVQYPHITPFDPEPRSYIFFHTEQQKQDYKERIDGVEWGTYDFHYIVGNSLGFPLPSVTYYASMRELENQIGEYPKSERVYGIGIIWASFFFSSHIDWCPQEIKWLWDTYNHPKANGLPLYLWSRETSYIEVPYLDFEAIRSAQEQIREARNLKSAPLPFYQGIIST